MTEVTTTDRRTFLFALGALSTLDCRVTLEAMSLDPAGQITVDKVLAAHHYYPNRA